MREIKFGGARISSNTRNHRWFGGVGMATGAALAAALIGLANAPVAGAEGSAVDTAVDNFLQGIANSFAPEVNEGIWADPDALCLTLLTCTEPPGDQMIDAFYQAVNTAFQPEGPIDGYFDQLFPAQTSALDMQVSILGLDLFPTAGNTATAASGPLDIAIAIGNGAHAAAGGDQGSFGGILLNSFDFAFADGTNSGAGAGDGSFDSAIVIGANSTAEAGGTLGISFGNFDLAAAFGDMLHAVAIGGFGPSSGLIDIVP
jgi:hypothetical protein